MIHCKRILACLIFITPTLAASATHKHVNRNPDTPALQLDLTVLVSCLQEPTPLHSSTMLFDLKQGVTQILDTPEDRNTHTTSATPITPSSSSTTPTTDTTSTTSTPTSTTPTTLITSTTQTTGFTKSSSTTSSDSIVSSSFSSSICTKNMSCTSSSSTSNVTTSNSTSTTSIGSSTSSSTSISTSTTAAQANTHSTSSTSSVSSYALNGRGITYSPYNANFNCKTQTEISSDLLKLQTFQLIRVYAPDCNCISALLSSITPHQKIFAGLFYMNSIESDIKLLVDQVSSSSRGWDAIYAVSIGNEWLNNGEYTVDQVISAISKAKSILAQNGYTGPVVTVDTVPGYKSNPSICKATDLITVNAHAYWDGNVKPQDSGAFLQNQIADLKALCPGKEVLITETGWPSRGNTFGTLGVPGLGEQLACVKSIAETVANKVIFFTMYNDFWKTPGPYGVEQYWGLFQ